MYISVDFELADHPKFIHLRRLVGQGAMEYLVRLWVYTGRYSPIDGEVFVDGLEEILRWSGERGKLIRSLTEAGWLEVGSPTVPQRLKVHDWLDHAGRGFMKLEENREAVRKHRKSTGGAITDPLHSPSPSPSPSLPTVTEPTDSSKTDLEEPHKSELGGQEPEKGEIDPPEIEALTQLVRMNRGPVPGYETIYKQIKFAHEKCQVPYSAIRFAAENQKFRARPFFKDLQELSKKHAEDADHEHFEKQIATFFADERERNGRPR